MPSTRQWESKIVTRYLISAIKNLSKGLWLVWLSGLHASLGTKGSLVWVPVRACAWVAARSPVGGAREAAVHWCFSPYLSPFLLLSLRINKILKKETPGCHYRYLSMCFTEHTDRQEYTWQLTWWWGPLACKWLSIMAPIGKQSTIISISTASHKLKAEQNTVERRRTVRKCMLLESQGNLCCVLYWFRFLIFNFFGLA